MTTTTPSRAEIIAQLKQAQERGGTTRFTYHGGSRPGKARDAIIIAVDDESGTFKIREQDSRLAKTLFIERVGWIADKEGEIAENPHVVPAPPKERGEAWDIQALERNPDYLKQVMAEHMKALESAGWVVQITATTVGLYEHLKNGNLRKHPTHQLSFQDRSVATVWDEETETMRTEHVGVNSRQRPWRVEGKGGSASNCGLLPAAIEKLLARALG